MIAAVFESHRLSQAGGTAAEVSAVNPLALLTLHSPASERVRSPVLKVDAREKRSPGAGFSGGSALLGVRPASRRDRAPGDNLAKARCGPRRRPGVAA